MAKTYRFTVDSTGSPEAVVVQTVCRIIDLGEVRDAASPVAWTLRRPDATSDAEPQFAGTPYRFEAPPCQFFNPGQIVGYVETASGSTTFVQSEQ